MGNKRGESMNTIFYALYFALHFVAAFLGLVIAIHISTWLGLTTRNTSIQHAKKCVFLTQMNFDKPYIFFCTYLDARKCKERNLLNIAKVQYVMNIKLKIG